MDRGRAVKRSKATVIPPPPDVLVDVLTRLPAKSLMRFKFVCKFWFSLIQDPDFAKLHHTRSLNRPRGSSLIVSNTNKTLSKQYFYFADHEGKTTQNPLSTLEYHCVSDIVNGLICLINPDHVSVCNLTTREIMVLPHSSLKPSKRSLQRHSCFLFGFDPSAYEYKVLKICHIVSEGKNNVKNVRRECEIFTLGTNSWRKINPGRYKFHSYCKVSSEHRLHIESVCVNGIIYWVHNPDTKGRRKIGAFDLRNEKFLAGIPFPPEVSWSTNYLIQIRGHLGLADCRQSRDRCPLRIWILEDCHNHIWIEKHIDIHYWFWHGSLPLPIGDTHSGEIILIQHTKPLKLFSYNQKRKRDGLREIEINVLPEADSTSYEELQTHNLKRYFVTDDLENIFPLTRDIV